MSSGAYLVSSAEDVGYVNQLGETNATLIAHDAVTAAQCNLPYFFPAASGDPTSARQVEYLVQHWYRDSSGEDRFGRDGVSFAQVITGSLWIAVASLFREWKALAGWIDRCGSVAVSAWETPRFQSVASSFGSQILQYDPGHTRRSLINTCNDRRLVLDGYPLHCQAKARIAKFFSVPFRWFRHGSDTIYINDWTYRNIVSADWSAKMLFGRTLGKGAFPVLEAGRIEIAEAEVDAQGADRITVEELADVLARIGVTWPQPLLDLATEEIRLRYRSLKAYLARCHALFSDLLDTYRPRRIVLSGECLEPHLLLMQMARARNVEVWLLGDGYWPTMQMGCSPALKTLDGKSWMISRIIGYGRATAEQFNQCGFPADRISLLQPAFLESIRPVSKSDPEWEATIATWFPNHLNPESREEWTCVMVCEVAALLRSLGYQRIAVKVKHPPERNVYTELQRRGLLLDSIDVVWEPFQQHLKKTALVVGGLGTGVIEAFNLQVPYFIYEPFENGYSNDCIRSSVLDPERIARSLPVLRENIMSGVQAVIRSKEDLLASTDSLPWN